MGIDAVGLEPSLNRRPDSAGGWGGLEEEKTGFALGHSELRMLVGRSTPGWVDSGAREKASQQKQPEKPRTMTARPTL